MSDDDWIIQQRIAGKSAREIAKAQHCSVGADQQGDRPLGGLGNHCQAAHASLALELARLDELQEVFYQHADAGDVPCTQLLTKLIE